jgi:hypothetical protein
MFERYTESARRAVFFARYEASQFGSDRIEAEHMLLGILREREDLRDRLPAPAPERIRNQIEERTPPRTATLTSIDLPLSYDLKRALSYGAEEAENMGHFHIETGHLVLGLLRVENSIAAQVLNENGITLRNYRSVVANGSVAPEQTPEHAPRPAAASLQSTVQRFESFVESSAMYLGRESDRYGDVRLKRKEWTRKQALGHLIDWATTHHQWFACALSEPKLIATGFPQDEWVDAQRYDRVPWHELVETWVSLNRLLVHVLSQIPDEKLQAECRIGIQPAISLAMLIDRYIDRCQDIMEQILSRG